VNIWGSLVSEGSTDRVFRIIGGGKVTVYPTGSFLVGNQLTGPAISDLFIYTGGELFLNGGGIAIDDQLQVFIGGALNMDAGQLFVHKFGEGSALGDYPNKSPFYIASGAGGEISGGTISVVGKPTSSGYPGIYIGDAGLNFSGNNLLVIRQGVSANVFDCSISAVPGVLINRIRISDSKRFVIESGLNIRDNMEVKPGSEVSILSGNTLKINP